MEFNELSKKYDGNPVLRFFVNAIPYVGGSLDYAFSQRWSEIRMRRIEEFMDEIQKELSGIKTLTEQHRRILESEEFYDLLYQINRHATQSRCKESRTGYARIIHSALEKKEPITSLEDLVRQVSEMTERDFIFITSLNEMYDRGEHVSGESVSKNLLSLTLTPIEAERQLYHFEFLGLLEHPRNRMTRIGAMEFEKLPLFDIIVDYINP